MHQCLCCQNVEIEAPIPQKGWEVDMEGRIYVRSALKQWPVAVIVRALENIGRGERTPKQVIMMLTYNLQQMAYSIRSKICESSRPFDTWRKSARR